MVLNTFDLMEEGDEEDRPKYRASNPPPAPPANAFGARPNDVPVVVPTPLDLSAAARPKTPIEASRLVLNDSSADVWGFAAVSSADQPLRRYRPPDQGLCSGNGIVIAGNNLVYRAFNATDGAVLQGPIAPQDFYGVGGERWTWCFDVFSGLLFFSRVFFLFGRGGKKKEGKKTQFFKTFQKKKKNRRHVRPGLHLRRRRHQALLPGNVPVGRRQRRQVLAVHARRLAQL
jgi:hypothetical protein